MTIQEMKDRGLLLLECISGSRAYGLATPQSDTDLKGVYYLPKDQFYGLDYIPQISNETNDEVYYELGRFVDLLTRNNPNILEILATPDESILYRHPVMDKLNTGMFLSRLCKDTFAGYAITQIRKARGLKKKIVNPVDKELLTVSDFCYVIDGYASVPVNRWLAENNLSQEYCGLTNIPHSRGVYALFYDPEGRSGYKGIVSGTAANDVSLSSVREGTTPMAYLFFNRDGYSAYCREYREYWEWVEKRNEKRFENTMQHGKNYDAKNMMHTIRLLQVALEILSTGQLNVKRPNRDELLSIKGGQQEYDALLAYADRLIGQIDMAYAGTSLPAAPDRSLINNILVGMRIDLYG